MQGVAHAFGRSYESSMPGVVLASALPDLNASAGYWREALIHRSISENPARWAQENCTVDGHRRAERRG